MLRPFNLSGSQNLNFEDTQYIDFTKSGTSILANLNLENGLFRIGQVHLPADLLYLQTNETQELVHIQNNLAIGVLNDMSVHEQEAILIRHLFSGNNIELQSITLDNSQNWALSVVFRFRSFNETWSRVFDFTNSAHTDGMLLAHRSTTRELIFHNRAGSDVPNMEIVSGIELSDNAYSLAILVANGTHLEFIHKQDLNTYEEVVDLQPVNLTGEFQWLGKSAWPVDGDANIDIAFFGLFVGQNAGQIAKALGHKVWRSVR